MRESQRALEAKRRESEASLAAREASLARVLAARAAGGAPQALRLALSGEDPAEVARQLYYLSILSRAAARLIEAHREGLAELERLRGESTARAAELERIEGRRRADRERILAERRERRRVLERLAGDIRKSRKEMRTLQADESRLARLVEALGRVIAAHPGASPGPFSSLRGRLRLPVRGELPGASGTPRRAGPAGSKGLFLRAPEGEPVRAVAAGRVVYADWMRGFGNLLILDHGEDYLSVYGYNESLLKTPGEAVAAGETIATVGASGGREDSGLYFELRHLGKAFDPRKWVKSR